MEKKFTTFRSRFDPDVTCFQSNDYVGLLRAICCNSVTGYVIDGRKTKGEDIIKVPSHAADAVADHLGRMGWTR